MTDPAAARKQQAYSEHDQHSHVASINPSQRPRICGTQRRRQSGAGDSTPASHSSRTPERPQSRIPSVVLNLEVVSDLAEAEPRKSSTGWQRNSVVPAAIGRTRQLLPINFSQKCHGDTRSWSADPEKSRIWPRWRLQPESNPDGTVLRSTTLSADVRLT